jgi:hypothetical protein
MKLLRSSLAILFAAGFSAKAQTTATTDPVGFVSYTVNANSDQRLGLPMQQASTFQGEAATVSGTIVSASGITSLSGANFLVVTSGTANGKWEQIQSSAAGSVTLVSSISGFANGGWEQCWNHLSVDRDWNTEDHRFADNRGINGKLHR